MGSTNFHQSVGVGVTQFSPRMILPVRHSLGTGQQISVPKVVENANAATIVGVHGQNEQNKQVYFNDIARVYIFQVYFIVKYLLLQCSYLLSIFIKLTNFES
jgi:hypothetical protein